MNKISDIEQNLPHKLSEAICIKCYKRWLSLRPTITKLQDLECPNCGVEGVVIETGEEINNE